MPLRLPTPAAAEPDLKRHFKQAIEALNHQQLPLQQGLERTSAVSLDDPFTAVILQIDEQGSAIRVKTGIFFAGIIGGCSCADDPTPVDTLPEYCELELTVERSSGETRVTLLEQH